MAAYKSDAQKNGFDLIALYGRNTGYSDNGGEYGMTPAAFRKYVRAGVESSDCLFG